MAEYKETEDLGGKVRTWLRDTIGSGDTSNPTKKKEALSEIDSWDAGNKKQQGEVEAQYDSRRNRS